MSDRWQDAYNDDPELANSPVLANFKTPQDALKGLVELKAYQGRSIKLPGDDATPEDKAQIVEKLRAKGVKIAIMPDDDNLEDKTRFWRELGVPDKADDYVPPESIDPLPDEMVAQLKDLAHKAGMTKQQYQAMLREYSPAHKSITEQNQTLQAEEETRLKQAWGGAYEQNLAITDEMVKQFQDSDVKLGPLNRAARLFLLNVAKSMSSEPQVFAQIRNPDSMRKTPAELRQDVEEMRSKLLDRSISGEKRKNLLNKYTKAFEELAQYQ